MKAAALLCLAALSPEIPAEAAALEEKGGQAFLAAGAPGADRDERVVLEAEREGEKKKARRQHGEPSPAVPR